MIIRLSTLAQSNHYSEEINDSIKYSISLGHEGLLVSIDFRENDNQEYRWVELYVKSVDNRLYRLHASGQLGEQVFNGQEWTEEWDWGNNQYWEATTHGLNTERNRFYEILLQGDLAKDSMTMMLVLFIADKRKDFSTKPTEITFPEYASRDNPDTWKTINITKY
ncbi:MAG: hypothetical protein CMB80_03930 [Flammeovirgaceae bacterium]|nr:hypothetical protein [Flammeovirgaceae bacterium]